MNKRELISELARTAELSRKDASAVIEALFGVDGIIATTLGAGEPVQISGFGTFDSREQPAREGRNPRDGRPLQLPPTTTPRFRAGKGLRDEVGGPSEGATRGTHRFGPTGSPPTLFLHPRDRLVPTPADDEIPVILSADAPKEIAVGAAEELRVRVECDDPDALPFRTASLGQVASRVDITVLVSVSGGSVQLIDPSIRTISPPRVGCATTTSFEIRAVAPGRSRIDLRFLQGAQPIAAIPLTVAAVAAVPGRSAGLSTGRSTGNSAGSGDAQRTTRRAPGHPRDPEAFQHAMYLHVEEREQGEGADRQSSYAFLLSAERLRLGNARWERTVDGTTGPFLQRLHRNLVERIRAQSDEDDRHFAERIVAKGQALGRLFPDEMVRVLWELRDDIANIILTTKERRPLPWELLRMVHPDRRGRAASDDRHLAEYGLSRQLSHTVGPRQLRSEDWGYMFAEYPFGTFPRTDFGRGWFEEELAASPGVTVRSLSSRPTEFAAALEAGDLDVIHVGCHGESELGGGRVDAEVRLGDREATSLIVGDRRVRRDTSQGPRITVEPVRLFPEDLRHRLDLSARAPIVFLNACESGRRPPGLHGLEGWPDLFLGAGAGAFVGTSWSVRGEAAEAFAVTFYRSLRNGETLSDATLEARQAAQEARRDASWLAYSVYGYPTARMEEVREEVVGVS